HDAQRQVDGERAALAIRALRRRRATQPLEELSRDAQPEPRTAEFARSRLVHLPEILPNRLQVARLDADARVDDVDAHAARRAPRLDGDPAAAGELHGVRQKVQQHLLYFRAIGV